MWGFSSAEDSHKHSLPVLESLHEFDDFMGSIRTMVDLGCGADAKDLEWWARASTRDEKPAPLNIDCTGVDIVPRLILSSKYRNLRYQKQDFEDPIMAHKKTYDVMWCHDSFQYVQSPLITLENWRRVCSKNGMLVIIVQQTTDTKFKNATIVQQDFCYHHWTVVSLMHALAVTGWDCRDGYFKKSPNDPWIYAVVYNSGKKPLPPKTTRWYDLVDQGLLPDSAVKSINKWGFLKQEDLILPWLDKSLNFVM